MFTIFCVKIQMSPLFNIILQVTKYMPTSPRSTFTYCASTLVRMLCSLFRTEHLPYCLYFKGLSYREDQSHLNERKQGTCTGNSVTNAGWTRKRRMQS